MNPPDTYNANIPGWASALELVADPPIEGGHSIPFNVDPGSKFLVGVVSTPNDTVVPWLEATLSLAKPNKDEFKPWDKDFVSEDGTIFVIQEPESGLWTAELSSTGRFPFALHMAAYQGAKALAALAWPSFGGFKCRACKMTAKALALAIVAAAALPAIPAALIAAVASYLGVGAVIAGAFISSIIGDTADVIAEKLCKLVKLCT